MSRAGLHNCPPPSNDFCVFEAILEYHAGDDGSILLQYNDVSNIDASNNYATIGIQDSYHQDGLGLTYANSYLPSVGTIVNNRAIRFTTTPPDNYLGADDSNGANMPQEFALHAAYPNPFNPTTELRFDLIRTGPASLKIYDMLGRETAVLIDKDMHAGNHSVTFDAKGLSSGLYFARLVSGSDVQVQKLMLVK
jgi:hypothetical protein